MSLGCCFRDKIRSMHFSLDLIPKHQSQTWFIHMAKKWFQYLLNQSFAWWHLNQGCDGVCFWKCHQILPSWGKPCAPPPPFLWSHFKKSVVLPQLFKISENNEIVLEVNSTLVTPPKVHPCAKRCIHLIRREGWAKTSISDKLGMTAGRLQILSQTVVLVVFIVVLFIIITRGQSQQPPSLNPSPFPF